MFTHQGFCSEKSGKAPKDTASQQGSWGLDPGPHYTELELLNHMAQPAAASQGNQSWTGLLVCTDETVQ